ncbi:hypothetical protein C8F01DRAFT_1120586 [Mycena amicta]|nr:hypothetical protein C8F01DRAFT_1120586 [Mycena amicta]
MQANVALETLDPEPQMFQNATNFAIHGGQFISAQGGVHLHSPPASSTQPAYCSTRTAHDEIYSDNELYCSQLWRRQRGFPLYVPQPQRNLPSDYLLHGVSIGDVGMVTAEGIWDFFFNIFLPSDDPINNGRVPEGFSPLEQYDESDVHDLEFEAGSFVASPSAECCNANFEDFPGGDYLFQCASPKGAILCLPFGSRLQKLARKQEHVRSYAAQNAKAWYQYINGTLGRNMTNGELYVITGCEKALAGGIATFQNVAAGGNFNLVFKAFPGIQSDYPTNPRYRFNRGTAAQTKSFPSPSQVGNPAGPHNSTIFLHEWSRKGSHRDVPFGSQGSSVSYFLNLFTGGGGAGIGKRLVSRISELAAPRKLAHPSIAIQQYILEMYPDAAVVITHDDDWAAILRDLPIASSDADLLGQHVREKFEIMVENGVAYLVSAVSAPCPVPDSDLDSWRVSVGSGEADTNFQRAAGLLYSSALNAKEDMTSNEPSAPYTPPSNGPSKSQTAAPPAALPTDLSRWVPHASETAATFAFALDQGTLARAEKPPRVKDLEPPRPHTKAGDDAEKFEFIPPYHCSQSTPILVLPLPTAWTDDSESDSDSDDSASDVFAFSLPPLAMDVVIDGSPSKAFVPDDERRPIAPLDGSDPGAKAALLSTQPRKRGFGSAMRAFFSSKS